MIGSRSLWQAHAGAILARHGGCGGEPGKTRTIALKRLEGDYGVARLAPDAPIPDWADGPGLVSITRSGDELSITCRAERIPAGVRADRDWRCWKFEGPFAFDEAGILLAVVRPLSEAGLGVYVVSSYDTDHLLLKSTAADRAEALLTAAGHRIL